VKVPYPRPFYRYSTYLKQKYGKAVYRISVDAGFSCPHRAADGGGGCTFCDELGSRAAYQEAVVGGASLKIRRGGKVGPERLEIIREQIERGREFLYHRYGAERYILYLQAFSNTFAPIDQLKTIYDFSLAQADFCEFIVSTRPDCVGKAHTELLSEYLQQDRDVWVELGLQSANNATLQRVHRAHTVEQFERAFLRIREAGLKVTVHLIFGLPGESFDDIMASVDYVASLRPEGVKIHNLNITAGTPLAEEYAAGEFVVPSGPRHLEYVIAALQRLPPETVIQRVTCDTSSERLIAPRYFTPKSRFYQQLDQVMAQQNISQGSNENTVTIDS